jgi:3-oxoacyl-[acyl-carrier-protein] synthase III
MLDGLTHSIDVPKITGPSDRKIEQSAKMSHVGLQCLSYFIPPTAVSVEQLGAMRGFSAEQVRHYRDVLGVKLFHDAKGASATEIALNAAKKLIENNGVNPLDIDAVVLYNTRFFTTLEPVSLVGKLELELGLRRAIGFSVWGQFCVSILAAIRVARNMIRSGNANVVLLVGTDTFLGSYKREIEGITLQGEGGSAFLLSRNSNSNRLIALSTRTEGSLYKGTCCNEEEHAKFKFIYFLSMTRVIQHTLQLANLTLEDIRLIIPHNINAAGWDQILHLLKCPREKLFGQNIHRLGHMFGADLVVNLSNAIESGAIRKGEYALLATAGMGANWGCAVIQH